MTSTPDPVLPTTLVLGYLTQNKTLVKARRVVMLSTLALALICNGIGLWVLVAYGWKIYREAQRFAAWGRRSIVLNDVWQAIQYLRWEWEDDWDCLGAFKFLASIEARLFYGALLAFAGLWLLIFSFGIKRGSPRACRSGIAMLVPVMMLTAGTTAICCYYGIVALLFPMVVHRDTSWLLWLSTLPLGAFLVAVMKDICAYLLWFARHPDVEKPRVEFLTGKAK